MEVPERTRANIVNTVNDSELSELRRQVYDANVGIFRAGLVTMHSGNVSAIDALRQVVLIKPSGMDYEKLTPEMLVATDLEGDVYKRQVLPGERRSPTRSGWLKT